jgi:hypothetical protein
VRSTPDDPLRGIVCRVQFGRGFILVNTECLQKVLVCSKCSMNGCLHRLGYDEMRSASHIASPFPRLLPNINPELFAPRQWCVRLVCKQSIIRFVSNVPDDLAPSFGAVEFRVRNRRERRRRKAGNLAS